jgi:hypothetical protein
MLCSEAVSKASPRVTPTLPLKIVHLLPEVQAWRLKQQGWPQRQIAAALGVSEGAVSQSMKRARACEAPTRQGNLWVDSLHLPESRSKIELHLPQNLMTGKDNATKTSENVIGSYPLHSASEHLRFAT